MKKTQNKKLTPKHIRNKRAKEMRTFLKNKRFKRITARAIAMT
jgi:hypothetical protein